MQHYFNQKDIQIKTEKGSVVALGKFDGFHQGHKLLLDEVLRLQKDGYTGVVFTFDTEMSPFITNRTFCHDSTSLLLLNLSSHKFTTNVTISDNFVICKHIFNFFKKNRQ